MRFQTLIGMMSTEKVSMFQYEGSSDVFTEAEACYIYLKERQKSKRRGARFLHSLRETLTQ